MAWKKTVEERSVSGVMASDVMPWNIRNTTSEPRRTQLASKWRGRSKLLAYTHDANHTLVSLPAGQAEELVQRHARPEGRFGRRHGDPRAPREVRRVRTRTSERAHAHAHAARAAFAGARRIARRPPAATAVTAMASTATAATSFRVPFGLWIWIVFDSAGGGATTGRTPTTCLSASRRPALAHSLGHAQII